MRAKTRIGWKQRSVKLPPEDFDAMREISREFMIDESALIRLVLRDGIVRIRKGELKFGLPAKNK